jgi:hypothetical protein
VLRRFVARHGKAWTGIPALIGNDWRRFVLRLSVSVSTTENSEAHQLHRVQFVVCFQWGVEGPVGITDKQGGKGALRS